LVFFNDTATPGNTALDGSSTAPDRSKVLTCADAGAATSAAARTAQTRRPGLTHDITDNSGDAISCADGQP
jgi:hypothetical protein